MNANQTQQDITAQRSRGKANLTWILLVGTLLMATAGPTMIVIFFGMLPTFVALIIDRTKGKSAAFCVGGINFIGVFPYMIDLWLGQNTFDQGLSIITDIFTLMVMYSAAAFGWVVFLGLPTMISSFVIIMQQRKVSQLRGEQKELIEEWGPGVTALVERQRETEQDLHMEEGFSDPSSGRT